MKQIWFYVVAAMMVGGLCWSGSSAHEGHPTHLPAMKADPIGFRNYLMENIGDNAKELNDKVRAGNVAAAKVNAQAIALHASRIPELFPPGSNSEESRAREEIWQQWDEFVKAAEVLRNEADQLGAMAATEDGDAVAAQVRKIATACRSCHDSFRKPDQS